MVSALSVDSSGSNVSAYVAYQKQKLKKGVDALGISNREEKITFERDYRRITKILNSKKLRKRRSIKGKKELSKLEKPCSHDMERPSGEKQSELYVNFIESGKKRNLDLSSEELRVESKNKPRNKKAKKLRSESKVALECAADSRYKGRKLLDWLLYPISTQLFVSTYWDKKPFLHQRKTEASYYNGIFSSEIFDKILRKNDVQFGKNLDVTTFCDDVRETHNPEGRAYPAIVWDYYRNGCSLRLINPQAFCRQIWMLCASLQEFFGSMVGANVYITPPGTQGFAPHFDDVDVLILQIEGRKSWSVYGPRNTDEVLPRFSSQNFSQTDMEGVKPIYADREILEAGDWLYMPRGIIHQARCLPDSHSLHCTISFGQLNTFGDLLLKMLPSAIENALKNDVMFRKSLPFDYLNLAGIAHTDKASQQFALKRKLQFEHRLKKMFDKIWSHTSIDDAVDQMGANFMHDMLPPVLSKYESSRSVIGGGERWHQGRPVGRIEFSGETEIRLIRAHCLRLVRKETSEDFIIVYSVDNSREYHAVDQKSITIGADLCPVLKCLIYRYPAFVRLDTFVDINLENVICLAQDLWETKLIITRNQLTAFN